MNKKFSTVLLINKLSACNRDFGTKCNPPKIVFSIQSNALQPLKLMLQNNIIDKEKLPKITVITDADK